MVNALPSTLYVFPTCASGPGLVSEEDDFAFRRRGVDMRFFIFGAGVVGTGRPRAARIAGLDDMVDERILDFTSGETSTNFCRTEAGTCSDSFHQRVRRIHTKRSSKRLSTSLRTCTSGVYISFGVLSFSSQPNVALGRRGGGILPLMLTRVESCRRLSFEVELSEGEGREESDEWADGRRLA
jgi:hypothetical protein